MSSPATDDQALTPEDFEDTNDSGSSSESSDSTSDSGSNSDSGSSIGREPGPDANSSALSRDELLAYLENMRRRFSTKPASDSFADQDEEVLIVSSKKKKLDLTGHSDTS